MKSQKGFTLAEVVATLVVASVLAGAFVGLLVPQINLFFFLPQQARVQTAADDLFETIFEGDAQARGLRYAESLWIAQSDAIRYTYTDGDAVLHDVRILFHSGPGLVRRRIDGGAPVLIPHYATTLSGIRVDALSGSFFRYYDSAGTEMTGTIALDQVYRVDVGARVSSGSGEVRESEGDIRIKSGAELKHFLTETPEDF